MKGLIKMDATRQTATIPHKHYYLLTALITTFVLAGNSSLVSGASEAVNGPHTVVTDQLPEISLPVEALPGGGYVAFGSQYLAVSKGSLLRWKLETFLSKPGAYFPGVQWLGGGTQAKFFYQSQSVGEKPWLGNGTENGLVAMRPGPKFRFVRPLWQVGPAAFLNSQIGVFVIAGNFVLTFDAGRHLRPEPHIPHLNVRALRWLPDRQLAAVEYGTPNPNIVKYQLTGTGGLRRVWTEAIPEIAFSRALKRHLRIAYGESGIWIIGASAKLIWLASNKDLYAVDSDSGKTLGIIPGQELTNPVKTLYRVPFLPTLPRQLRVEGHDRPHLPSWAWRGQLVPLMAGRHIFAFDRAPNNAPAQAGNSKISIWKISHAGLDFDFSFSGNPPDQYLRTKKGIFAFHFGGRIQRVSFRKKALVPVKLRVRVPGPGPWDPQPPVPRWLGARFVALFGKSSPLPPRVEFQIMKMAQRKFFYTRDRFKYMVDRAQAYLKENATAPSHPASQ